MKSYSLALFNITGNSISQLAKLEVPTEPDDRVLASYKDFLFVKSKNMAVISFYNRRYKADFCGAIVFNIDKEKKEIVEEKRINHKQAYPQDYFWAYVQNSMYIGSYLYTTSSCLIRINSMDQGYSPVGDIALPCKRDFRPNNE